MMGKTIEIGERRTVVTTSSEDVIVHYELELQDGNRLGAGWDIHIPNNVLEALHKELSKQSCHPTQTVEPKPLTDDQRAALASAIYPPLFVAAFESNTPEEVEEHKRVDAFVSGMGITGLPMAGGLQNLSVEIPKDRPKPS
jgi:hypothetical protein